MNYRKDMWAALIVVLLAMGLIVYGVQSDSSIALPLAVLILAFIIGDGFITYYGFDKIPNIGLWDWFFGNRTRLK